MFKPGLLQRMAQIDAGTHVPAVLCESDKPIITELLQARVDGNIVEAFDMVTIISKHAPADGFSFDQLSRLTELAEEVLPCDNIPAARELARKYNLTIIL